MYQNGFYFFAPKPCVARRTQKDRKTKLALKKMSILKMVLILKKAVAYYFFLQKYSVLIPFGRHW